MTCYQWASLTLALLMPLSATTLAQPAADDAALTVSERLMNEARRQRAAEARLGALVGEFDRLVADLRSNELERQGGAAALEAAAKVLERLKDRDIPEVAQRLEDARRELSQLRPHLDAAGRQVDAIIEQLDELRRHSRASHEQLVRELQAAAHEQGVLHERTKAWGRETFQDPAAAKQQAPAIAATQEQVARQVKRAEEELRRAAEQEADPLQRGKLERALQVMQRQQPVNAMERAASAVAEHKPLDAVKRQELAAAGLEAALRELQPDQTFSELDELKDARAKLESIRQQQTELRREIQAKPDEAFVKEKLTTQAAQRQLSQELKAVASADRESIAPATAAREAMAQAETAALAEDKAATTAAQQQAEASLDQAIAELDRRMAQIEQTLNRETAAATQLRELQADQQRLAEQTAAARAQGSPVAPLAAAQDALAAAMNDLASAQPQNPAAQQAAAAMSQATQAMRANEAEAAHQRQQEAISRLEEAMTAASQTDAPPPGAAQELAAAASAVEALAERQSELRERAAEAAADDAAALRDEQAQLREQVAALEAQAKPAASAMAEAQRKMGEAEAKLGAGDPKPALPPQQAAEDALREAAVQLAQAASEAHAQAQAAPSPPPGQDAPEQGAQEMGPMAAGGAAPRSGDARWRALAQRQREALDQEYARELPAEYRDLLEDYYEALAE